MTIKSYDMILPLVVNYCCQRQRTCAAYWNVYFQAVARVCKRYLISFIHSFIHSYSFIISCGPFWPDGIRTLILVSV